MIEVHNIGQNILTAEIGASATKRRYSRQTRIQPFKAQFMILCFVPFICPYNASNPEYVTSS